MCLWSCASTRHCRNKQKPAALLFISALSVYLAASIGIKNEVSKYYFHGVSHHLGLDTHDVAIRKNPLTPGCVITVEPGLYILEEGIGIRIEDDILVTENGVINLSSDIIESVDDIEEFMERVKK